MENKTTMILVILCISAAVFILIGLGQLFSPETREGSFRKVRARVVSSGTIRDGESRPLLEFRDGEKTVRAYPNLAVPVSREGEETDILYCPKRVLLIPTQSVIPDDGGASLRRIARQYRLTGAAFLLVGLLFLIPIILLIRKR